MLDNDLIQMATPAFAAIAVSAAVYALLYPYISGKTLVDTRRDSATRTRTPRLSRNVQAEQISNRRKTVADTLKELDHRQKASQRKATLTVRLQRAGLDFTPKAFRIASAISGATCAMMMLVLLPWASPITAAGGAFIGMFGLPRWALDYLAKRRQEKFAEELANAIDIIVRGVKSGLPLLDCLGVIARETPEPIRSEFRELVEQHRVGVPLPECFERMIARMPLTDVKFVAIVVAIQQQAGGSLSETLGNLSGLLRDRKRLQAKVKALSAEAKASAAVLGALPFVVMLMVYTTTPDYIAYLWTTTIGQFLLIFSAGWMTIGLLVMRHMINFRY